MKAKINQFESLLKWGIVCEAQIHFSGLLVARSPTSVTFSSCSKAAFGESLNKHSWAALKNRRTFSLENQNHTIQTWFFQFHDLFYGAVSSLEFWISLNDFSLELIWGLQRKIWSDYLIEMQGLIFEWQANMVAGSKLNETVTFGLRENIHNFKLTCGWENRCSLWKLANFDFPINHIKLDFWRNSSSLQLLLKQNTVPKRSKPLRDVFIRFE